MEGSIWTTANYAANCWREGINLHLPLSVKVRKEASWPTPLADDAKQVNPSDKRQKTLVSSTKGSGMKLNPNWVEQLMGLPAGWTQLPAHWLTG